MKIDKKIAEIIFKAGMKCQEMHPDDDTYDKIHFERVMKKVNKISSKPLLKHRFNVL